MKETVSVVVPVYRSRETLRELHRRLVAVLASHAAFEIIFVDDGSGDECWTLIEELARADPRVRGLRLSRNYGQHNALLCGIRAAGYELIVTLDDDLQNPPEEIPKLLGRLREGFDVVYGAPREPQHGLLRGAAASITKLVLAGAIGSSTARHVSAFRAFRAYVREAFRDYAAPFVSVDVLLTWGTTRFSHVPVTHDARAAGASNYTLRKLITHALTMVTGFTTLPLQLASVLGFAFALFGLAVLAYVLIVYVIHGGSVPGFPFLASVIAIFAGVQLFALGIIGEYLARMHVRSMSRPPYLVRETAPR
ncbi:MAG TPA: glycosyltransferase family 2 protein [Burkholderiales bacterium]|jgi:undecaprenyl-phosphate 4-deoxy-4-formamido-L-arabinose transferase